VAVIDAIVAWTIGAVTALQHVDARLLAAGVALHLLAEAVRQRAWWNILRAALPTATALRVRDVLVAYFGGGGLNSVIPVRGGDAVKLALLRRRAPEAGYGTLAVTLVPETICECAMGLALVAWAIAAGHVPFGFVTASITTGQLVLGGVAVVAAAGAVVVLGVRRRERLLGPMRQGLAIVGTPRRFAVGVASWQALARPIRLLSLMCFLGAFGLVSTPEAALVAMAVGGAGRIRVPGAGVALRAGALAYALPHATHSAVDAKHAVAFSVGLQLFSTVVGLATSAVVLSVVYGVHSPRHALRSARSGLRRVRADALAESPEAPLPRPAAGAAQPL
jgi:lysylphosphatidylglycerol synthase-like protein